MTNSETSPKAEGRKPNQALAAIDESRVANGILRICSFGFPSDFISTRLPAVGFFTLAILAMFSSGCAGYKLGPTNGLAAQEKSVEIAPFANQTLQPRLGDAVTFQIRKQLQHEGTYRLATGREGDILVTGVVTHYGRQGVSFVPTDVVTVRDYRLSMTAQVTARERGTGKVILNQPVSGSTLIRLETDLTSSERQALPLLAGDLARNVASLLADGS